MEERPAVYRPSVCCRHLMSMRGIFFFYIYDQRGCLLGHVVQKPQ